MEHFTIFQSHGLSG